MVQQTDIDAAVRDTHIPAAKHWIGGKQVDASDGNVMANTSPIDGKPLGALARGTHTTSRVATRPKAEGSPRSMRHG